MNTEEVEKILAEAEATKSFIYYDGDVVLPVHIRRVMRNGWTIERISVEDNPLGWVRDLRIEAEEEIAEARRKRVMANRIERQYAKLHGHTRATKQ